MGRKQPSIGHIIDSLVQVFPGLTNLTRFEVEAWDFDYDLQSFFRSAWSSVGRQLETISMAGRPENFRQFIRSDPQPSAVYHVLDPMAVAAVDEIAPFINSLSPQLQSLKIWSWSTLDLSLLFLNLGHFPQLHHFLLRAPFNKAFSDPTGLTTILEANSATLDTIELRLNPAGSAMNPNSEQLLGKWLSSHRLNPSVLANLKLLRMYPTTLSSGFDALVMYMERSANTLTTLAVQDRYLDLDEVEALIAPVSHRGADDGLEPYVSIAFDLLALKLPGLKSLSMYVGGSQPHPVLTEMQTHSYKSWKLRDIGIWQGGSEVPFWGNGHMLGESKIYE
ncbi:hypothetical protein B0H13DRAFT_1966859 [Mycena leptocephala]|nr:hypothetical protein B0H13DRAFT_1966859 [Mycena leptocephala]